MMRCCGRCAAPDAGACTWVSRPGQNVCKRRCEKNLDLAKAPSRLEFARRLGMETRGYFMIGFPGETAEEIERTISLSVELPLDWASYTITTPNPGTEIYEEGRRNGRFPSDYWRDYTLGKVSGPPGFFTSDEMSESDLRALLRSAYKRFYLRPGLIARKIARPRFWKEIPEIARTLFQLRRSRSR